MRLAGPAQLPRRVTLVHTLERNHPASPPHYYLPFVGVAPDRRGMGIGTALLRATLSRLDREGLGAYLENSNPRNAGLYERLGFATLRTLRMPDDGPSIWCMWRGPRGPADPPDAAGRPAGGQSEGSAGAASARRTGGVARTKNTEPTAASPARSVKPAA